MDDIQRALNRRKTAFLDSVETDIKVYIESRGKQCIAIVERSSDGSIYRTWNVHLDSNSKDFCKVLFKFTRRHQYNGHDLDSALTDPICDRVQTKYQDFYQSESDAISNGMLVMLAADELKLQSFMDRIADIALESFSKKVKKQVVHLVVHLVKTSVEQGSMHTVGNHIGNLAATTAGAQVAGIVVCIFFLLQWGGFVYFLQPFKAAIDLTYTVMQAQLLLKLLAANIAHIVAKTLGSAVLKKVLAILVKKFILAAVTTAVVQFLATHVSAAVGGSTVMWVVLPLIVAYIGYKIATFPEKLGDKVSKKIRVELEQNFESTNKTMLQKIFDTVFSGNELVQIIAKDEEFQTMLKTLEKNLHMDKEPWRLS